MRTGVYSTELLNIPGAVGGPGAGVFLVIVATMNIPAYAVVTSLGKRADSGNPAQGYGKVIGLSILPILNGFSGAVQMSGEVTNGAWAWVTGAPIFLNGTSLSMTPPVSGFLQFIGTAKGPTKLVLEPDVPILL